MALYMGDLMPIGCYLLLHTRLNLMTMDFIFMASYEADLMPLECSCVWLY